jgi:Coenzyme F420-reducing hydrogenase, gamma subunit
MMKPKVAFFDFASCEGCQLQVINLEESILNLVEIVDVVSFREAMKEHSDEYDIAFIEGSIARPMDEERLRGIREKAKILVALGACACIGGVNALRNQFSVEEVKRWYMLIQTSGTIPTLMLSHSKPWMKLLRLIITYTGAP